MEKFNRNVFKETIRILRNRKGLTQDQFAELIGVGRNTVTTYEIGRSVPALDTIIEICNVLDCEISTLIFGLQHTGYSDNEKEFRLKHSIEMFEICEKEKKLLKEFLDSLDRKNEELSSELEKVKLELQQYKSKRA